MNTTQAQRQILTIELLALDLTSCGRCVGTERNLEDALETVSAVLREADVETKVEKHVVTTTEQAERLRMIASPTVRVNGEDIALDLRESNCGDCGDLCGCDGGVDCRVWVWKGKEYLEAPKGMIIDAVLRAHTAGPFLRPPGEYRLPDNLRKLFAAKEQAAGNQPEGRWPKLQHPEVLRDRSARFWR
jgi:hypothetical protein